jgi:hypothetical protein
VKARAIASMLVLGVLIAAISSDASANGRFPTTVDVRFHPADDSMRLVSATFGLLISSDGGASYQWVCEVAIGYGGTYDPDYAVAADGSIFATTFDGLRVSRDGGCTFELVGGELDGLFPGAVDVAPNGDVWTCATLLSDNGAFRSTDNGVSFARTNVDVTGAWWHSIAVAPTDSNRVYVSGFVTPGTTPDAGPGMNNVRVLRTDDAGDAWIELPATGFVLGDEQDVFIEAVSPTDPDVVYARVRRANPPNGDAVYRSDDAGQSWVKVLDTLDAITAFVARADGTTVIVGTQFDGVRISPNRGASWSLTAAQPQMGCVGERGDGELFACGANWEPDHFALGRSTTGQTWQTVLEFREIAGPLECAPGTLQFDECTVKLWPSLAEQLGVGNGGDDAGPIDAGAGIDAAPGIDAPAGATIDAGTGDGGGDCGCSTGFAAAVFVWPRRRRR